MAKKLPIPSLPKMGRPPIYDFPALKKRGDCITFDFDNAPDARKRRECLRACAKNYTNTEPNFKFRVAAFSHDGAWVAGVWRL